MKRSGSSSGIPLEGGVLGFELLETDSNAWTKDAPRGEPGRIEGESAGGVNVRFPSGCVIRVELPPGKPGIRIGRMEILSCEVERPFIVILRLRLSNREQPYFMIPAVLYGTNNAGRGVVENHPAGLGSDPQLDYRAEKPQLDRFMSPSWHFRADRSSLPSVSANFDGRFAALGIAEVSQRATGEWVYNSLGIGTSSRCGDSISVAMGSLDWPARTVHHVMEDGPTFEPLTKETAVGMATTFALYSSRASDRFAYERFAVGWYGHIHEPPREGPALERAMRDVGDALLADGIDPQTGFFHCWRGPEGIAPAPILLAWAGILQIARPLIETGKILGEERYIQVAAAMVERTVKEAFNPQSGLFFEVRQDGRWRTNTWWPALGHTSLINGHACCLLLKMYEDDNRRKTWADAARRVLEHVIAHQRDDGRLPSGFSGSDGAPTTYVGYGGCFFVAPLLMLGRLFGDRTALRAARRALEHYWDQFMRLEWIGVNLDCRGAVDAGSGNALISALVELHRQEGEDVTLERLGHALHYVCSYHFGHNTRHRNAVCDWSSSGAMVTSTHNVHLDAYGGLILGDLQYYVTHAGDPYFQSRIEDSAAWARQAYNRTEAEYGWGKVGWTTEQFYHTYDSYFEPEGDGTIWVAYFTWAAGALLEAFLTPGSCRPSR